ncbi:hypothetical protein AXK58_21775 [Tsukamurella tyrosinosolvens]|nr:hypothetical protein AXK58_21775 [Tsukamurella tyrosinosolvens]
MTLDELVERIGNADWGRLPLHVAGRDGHFEVENRAYSPSRIGLDLFVPDLSSRAPLGVPFQWQGFTCWILDTDSPTPPRELYLPTLTTVLAAGDVAIVDRELLGPDWILGIAPLTTT